MSMVLRVSLGLGVLSGLFAVGLLGNAVYDFVNYRSGAIEHSDEAWAETIVGMLALATSAWAFVWSAVAWNCAGKVCAAVKELMMVQSGAVLVVFGVVWFSACGVYALWSRTPAGLRPLLMVQGVVVALLVVMVLR